MKMPADVGVGLEEGHRVGFHAQAQHAGNADQRDDTDGDQGRPAVLAIDGHDSRQQALEKAVDTAVGGVGRAGWRQQDQHGRKKGQYDHQQADHAEAGETGELLDRRDGIDRQGGQTDQGGAHGQADGQAHLAEGGQRRRPGRWAEADLLPVFAGDMQAIGRSHGDQKDRYDDREHGDGDVGKGHRAQGPDHAEDDAAQRQDPAVQVAEQHQEEQADDQEGDGGQVQEILAGIVGQGLGNQRHAGLVKAQVLAGVLQKVFDRDHGGPFVGRGIEHQGDDGGLAVGRDQVALEQGHRRQHAGKFGHVPTIAAIDGLFDFRQAEDPDHPIDFSGSRGKLGNFGKRGRIENVVGLDHDADDFIPAEPGEELPITGGLVQILDDQVVDRGLEGKPGKLPGEEQGDENAAGQSPVGRLGNPLQVRIEADSFHVGGRQRVSNRQNS
ncbi:hypothetical protein DESC_120033 [Desulfosarcina cetonica]|nr:hypothetical protein DESC_120033 [Desulfosarcina cetonica]